MDGTKLPPGGDQDRGPTMIVVYWTMFAIELLFVSLRVCARSTIHALGWDDCIMACTMLIVLGMNISGTFFILAGGCRHTIYLLLDKGIGGIETVIKLWYVMQPFAIMAIAVGRMSVAVLILRIMGPSKWRRIFLYFSIISTFVISTVACIIIFAACDPPRALWDPLIKAKCWNENVGNYMAIATSAWNVLMDVCLALLPVWIFWDLKLNKKKKVTLCVLMSMGVFAGVCGAIKASKIAETTMSDFTWATYDLFLWNGAETFLIIVCGCIPTLKPIYDQLFNRRARVPSGPPSYAPYMKSYKSASSGPSKPPSNKHSLSFAESTLPYNKDVSITITQMSSVRSLSDGSNGTETIRSDTEKGLVVNVSEKIPNDYVHRKPGFDPYPLDTLDMV